MNTPDVSFLVASYNAGRLLPLAVRSALSQQSASVEVIVVDDHSTDGSDRIAEELAVDDRVRFARTERNGGPAAARNVALDLARGTWLAVLDSDDLIRPDRSARLMAEAQASGADMIADDLLLFDDALVGKPSLFLDRRRAREPGWITLPDYFDETRMYGPRSNLGFLKPMIRRGFLEAHAIRYDPRLRIAEDDDFVVRCLEAGAAYRLLPLPLYHYRKHSGSISHRLSSDHAERMKAASDALRDRYAAASPALARVVERRCRATDAAYGFAALVAALGRGDALGAARAALKYPRSLPLLRIPAAARLRRALGRRASRVEAPAATRRVALISKQRVTGPTNGSSAYLLSIAEAVRDAGFAVDLLQPSPLLFGRTPVLHLSPAMRVFATHHVAGAWRAGDWLFARDLSIYAAAARGLATRWLRRLGLDRLNERKAPYAIAAPWTRQEHLFLAGHAALRPHAIVADYAFQAEGFADLLAPDARSAIVMHDLFHARAGQFGEAGDSVASLSFEQEVALLGLADAVIAIQDREATFVRTNLPAVRTLLVPMPARPVDRAQPGEDDLLLFVGSNTAPNVLGLQWFLDEVWPALRTRRPGLRLEIAGKVAEGFPRQPAGGVLWLGLVADLAPLYARAGIVISPLRQGSGLKIKLIEALACGKATVVTPTTLQGVEWLDDAPRAVACAETAEDFAEAILQLAGDAAAREALGKRALAAAREEFGAAKATAELRAWLHEKAQGTVP